MRYLALLLAGAALFVCTWETYQDQSGHTGLRPKYEAGTRVAYEDGSYAQDQRYNSLRAVPHTLTPGQKPAAEPAPPAPARSRRMDI